MFIVCLFQFIYLSILLAILIIIYAIFRSENIRCMIEQIKFRMSHCGTGNSDPTIDLFFRLEDWLDNNSAIRDALVWEAPDRRLYHYHEWSSEQKNQLANAYSRVNRGQSVGIPEAPPLDVALSGSGDVYTSRLEAGLAWEYYLAYITQSLMAEAKHWFAWSLNNYSPEELALLFDSRYLFVYRNDHGKYCIQTSYSYPDLGKNDNGTAIPGDPGRIFAFMDDNNMIGATQRQTIENLMSWCRDNLVHYYGYNDQDNLDDHWQYRGFPPIERVIAGTVRTSRPEDGVQHWTAGCWGTMAFLKIVLRTANIPVKPLRLCGSIGSHSTVHFTSENLYLSHGDDLYGKYHHATPPIPIGELFTTQDMFDSWFGEGVPDDEVCNNVGRRPIELALVYLPNGMLRRHCDDIAAGLDHANSTILQLFSSYYTIEEIEAINLWQRMDDKIAGFGGCDNIPETPGLYGQNW